MSHVTGVVLITDNECFDDIDDAPDALGANWDGVNAWLVAAGFAPLAMVENGFSGTKWPQIRVGGGGYNHFPAEGFAAFVRGLPWETPEQTVLIMTTEDDEATVTRPSVIERVLVQRYRSHKGAP